MKFTNEGYSLLEVLVAFAVMAMVLSVLVPGQVRLFGRTITADDSFLATDYALSRMDRLGVSDEVELGRRDERYRNWRVVQTVEVERLGNLEAGVLRIVLRIETPGGTKLAEVESVRAR